MFNFVFLVSNYSNIYGNNSLSWVTYYFSTILYLFIGIVIVVPIISIIIKIKSYYYLKNISNKSDKIYNLLNIMNKSELNNTINNINENNINNVDKINKYIENDIYNDEKIDLSDTVNNLISCLNNWFASKNGKSFLIILLIILIIVIIWFYVSSMLSQIW